MEDFSLTVTAPAAKATAHTQSAPPRIPNPFAESEAESAGGASRPQKKKAESAGGVRSKKKKVVISSASSIKHWFRRQRKKHMATMTPEMMTRMKKNIARQNREQRKHRLARKCKKISYGSHSARSHMMSSLASYTPAVRATTSVAQQREARLTSLMALEKAKTVQSAALSASESEDEIDALEQEADVAMASVTEEAAQSLLEQLRTEPKNDEEMAEKFKVYESYNEVCSKSRDECVAFHKTCTQDLREHPGVVKRMTSAMKSIDSEANNSINWDNLHGRWFVYDMTKQCDRNNAFIGRIFHGLKRDLDMIQDNDMDCPICLENLQTVPSGVRVLHCCHKLCVDCYTHWQAACRGGRVICPLCRHKEFQTAVVTRAPTFVQQYLHDMHSESDDSDSEGEAEAGEAGEAGEADSGGPQATVEPVAQAEANATTED